MTIHAGSVTVDDDGTVTKDELAEAIYDSFVDNYETDFGTPMPDHPASLPIKRGFAQMATRMAAIADYLLANVQINATATIAAGAPSNGLQRDPVSPFDDCLGPSTGKTLPVSGGIL